MRQPPKTFDASLELLHSDELDDMLKARLVQLAFGDNAQASIRAIEMLQGVARVVTDDELGDLPLSVLLELQNEVSARLVKTKDQLG